MEQKLRKRRIKISLRRIQRVLIWVINGMSVIKIIATNTLQRCYWVTEKVNSIAHISITQHHRARKRPKINFLWSKQCNLKAVVQWPFAEIALYWGLCHPMLSMNFWTDVAFWWRNRANGGCQQKSKVILWQKVRQTCGRKMFSYTLLYFYCYVTMPALRSRMIGWGVMYSWLIFCYNILIVILWR